MTADETPVVRIALDTELCIGSGYCELLEAESFAIDDDTAIAALIGEPQLPRDRARIVVDRCPSGAISIVEPTESP